MTFKYYISVLLVHLCILSIVRHDHILLLLLFCQFISRLQLYSNSKTLKQYQLYIALFL